MAKKRRQRITKKIKANGLEKQVSALNDILDWCQSLETGAKETFHFNFDDAGMEAAFANQDNEIKEGLTDFIAYFKDYPKAKPTANQKEFKAWQEVTKAIFHLVEGIKKDINPETVLNRIRTHSEKALSILVD